MTPYAGVPAWPATIEILDDGESAEAATLAPALEALKNATVYLKTGADALADHVIGTGAGELVRFPFLVLPIVGQKWEGSGLIGPIGLCQSDASAQWQVPIELVQPKKCTLTDLSITVVGAPGHADVPSQRPRLKLYRQDCNANAAPTLLGDVPDGSLTGAQYMAPHAITILALAEVLDPAANFRYYVHIVGEAGPSNNIAGLVVTSLHGHTDPL